MFDSICQSKINRDFYQVHHHPHLSHHAHEMEIQPVNQINITLMIEVQFQVREEEEKRGGDEHRIVVENESVTGQQSPGPLMIHLVMTTSKESLFTKMTSLHGLFFLPFRGSNSELHLRKEFYI